MISRIASITLISFIVIIVSTPTLLEAQATTSNNYSVTFTEKGLPNGTQWFVSVHGSPVYSNNSTITFTEQNGTYLFTIGGNRDFRPLPGNFSVNIRGHNISLVVIWVPVLYNVTFIESGLPVGTFWNVTLGNETYTSLNSTITFKVMNGTYEYTIPAVNGVVSSTPNGTIKVYGAQDKVFLSFSGPVNFTFFESGLPQGARWSIWIDGSYYNTTTSMISVTLPNGTYSYFVKLPTGYNTKSISGTVNYSNDLVFINVSSYLPYEIVIAVLVAFIFTLSFIYIKRRRRTKSLVTNNDRPEKR